MIPVSDNFVGTLVLGRYRVLRLLAMGGMGAVYLARTEGASGIAVPVVIKRILPSAMGDTNAVKSFQREAKILSTLRHPNIVSLLDFSLEGTDYVMVMEYIRGYNLARWLRYTRRRKRDFPVDFAIHIAIAVLDALHYAHTLPGPDGQVICVVHRDVTPGNVIVETSGHIKLVDFGIARSEHDHTEATETTGLVKGKLPYIAPEIFARKEPSATSDVYSVAMLLHEVLRGQNEMLGDTPVVTMYNLMHHTPTLLNEVRTDVTVEQASVIAKGLAKKPQERYTTAKEFAQALRAVRKLSSEDAQENIATAVSKDFFAADFGDTNADLATIERVLKSTAPWAHTSGSQPLQSMGTISAPLTPTAVEAVTAPDALHQAPPSPIPAALPTPPRSTNPALFALAGAGACVLAGGIGFAVYRASSGTGSSQSSEPEFVYIQTGTNPASADAARAAPNPPPSGIEQPRPVANATPDASIAPPRRPSTPTQPAANTHAPVPSPTASPPTMATSLTQIVARENTRIARCFDGATPEVLATPDTAIRFRVSATGEVEQAWLLPEALGQTPNADCVLRVARTLRFGQQAGPLLFRVAISLRRSP